MVEETRFDLIHVTDGVIELYGIGLQRNLGFVFFVGELLPELLGAVAVVVRVLLGVMQHEAAAGDSAGRLRGHLGTQTELQVQQQPRSRVFKLFSYKKITTQRGKKSI